MTKLLFRIAGYRLTKAQARSSVAKAAALAGLICIVVRPSAAALVCLMEYMKGWF